MTCGPAIGREVNEKVRILNDLLKVFLGDKELKAALSHCDLIINQASSLAEFEARGIATLTTPPSVIVKQYRDLRERLTREWFKAELESATAEAATTTDANRRIALVSKVLLEIQKYRSEARNPNNLEDLEKQASEALHEIRQRAFENEAEMRQPPDTENPSDTRNDFSAEGLRISSEAKSKASQVTATAYDESCPYCRQPLRKVPKRRALCPHCKKAIYVRAKQNIIPSTTLFTERDARAITWLGQIEVSRDEVEAQREKLSRQFGQVVQLGDVFWQIMNDRVREAMKKPRTDAAQQLPIFYRQMACFLYEEGRDHLRLSQEAQKWVLMAWQDQMEKELLARDLLRVQVITCGEQSCEECKKLAEAKFTIEEALEQMPLPVKNCTHDPVKPSARGWCRCCYGLSSALE